MKNKMEFGYEEIPINFLSRSSSKGQLGGSSGYHNMSVPMIHMLKAEKNNMMKEAEKKQAADRALKQKLKSIAQPQGKFSKKPSEAQLPRPSQPKPEHQMTGTSFRILRLPGSLPVKSHTQPFFSSQESTPRLPENSPIGNGQKFYTQNFPNIQGESPLKPSFVSTTFADKKKHYKSYASLEVNYGATEKDNDQRLNLRLMNSEMKSPVHTLQSLTGSKTPELKVEWRNFESSPGEGVVSPKKRLASKNTVLKLMRHQGSLELSPLEHDPAEKIKSAAKLGGDDKLLDRRGVKLKTLSQNPSQDRLFAVVDHVRENKSNLISPFLPKIDGLAEDLASSEVLTTEGNTSKKKKAVFNFAPEISKYMSSPKGKLFMIPKNSSPPKRLQSISSKDKVVENKMEKSPTKQSKLLEFSPKKKTLPVNPIFTFEENDEQDIHIRQLATNGQENMPEEEKRKLKFSIIRRKLLRCLKKMKNLKISPQELVDRPMIFNSEPYTKPGSKQFLEAAKLGRLDKMQEIIEDKNRYLVYDFDNVHMTALHYAAKKGYTDMAKFLIANGANVDARDIIGRTPLYFAIQSNNIDILKILLANHCQTWSNEEAGYAELCKNNQIAWFYLSKMRKLDITLKLTPPNLRELIWQRESQEILRRKYVAEEGPAQKRLD